MHFLLMSLYLSTIVFSEKVRRLARYVIVGMTVELQPMPTANPDIDADCSTFDNGSFNPCPLLRAE